MLNALPDLRTANIGCSKMNNQSEFSSFKKKTRRGIISVPLLQEMSVFHFLKAFLNRGVNSIPLLPNLLPKIGKRLLCFVRIGVGQSRDGGMKFQPAAERSLLIYSSSISESSCWFWGFFLYLDISESSLTRLIASFWPLKFNKLKACLKSFKFF